MSDMLHAIGDVHGQLAQLETALSLIEKDGGAEAKTVFVRDRRSAKTAAGDRADWRCGSGPHWTIKRQS